MGTIAWDETQAVIEGVAWEMAAYTTTDDMSRQQEDGLVNVLARPVGSAEWTHGCDVFLRLYSESFSRRFWRAFKSDSGFRDRCRYDPHTGQSLLDIETAGGQRLPRIPASADPGCDGAIARLIKRGPKKARFGDFARLRSGRDRFSSMRTADLEGTVGEAVSLLDACIQARAQELPAAERDKALRWMARGLPADMALRKVLVDLEISSKARPRR